MNYSDWYGLLACAVLIGCLIGFCFRGVYARCIAAFLTAAGSLIPFSASGCSAAMYLFALIDGVSVPLIAGALFKLLKLEQPNRKKKAAAGIFLFGLILFAGAMGALPFDLYRYGYNPAFALIAVITGIILTDAVGAVLLLIGYVLFLSGVYDNCFNSFIDPILWITAIVYLTRILIGKLKKSAPLENEIENTPI